MVYMDNNKMDMDYMNMKKMRENRKKRKLQPKTIQTVLC